MEKKWDQHLDEGKTIKDLPKEEIEKMHKSEKEFAQSSKKELTKEEADDLRLKLGGVYDKLIGIFTKYCDLKPEYYPVIATWVMGTYIHDSFKTYPYLFLNAMKASGKSRLLGLISKMSHEGSVMASPTEATLFRSTGTLGIDEFEKIGRKGSESIQELLNGSYKKGTKIKRMRKAIDKTGEHQEIEEFEIFRPIVMANIWGMDDVLGDRCITLILERSVSPVTKLMEIWDEDEDIISTLHSLHTLKCMWCMNIGLKYVYRSWNNYILDKYPNKLNYTTTYTTTYTTYIPNNTYLSFFNKIDESGINGRNLELSFPLFLIANYLSDDNFDEMLKIISEVVIERTKEEFMENNDVSFVDFVSQLPPHGFLRIKRISNDFKEFLQQDDSEEKWINPRWCGAALKRHNLILERRRMSVGIEVKLNIKKAQEKILMFKEKEE